MVILDLDDFKVVNDTYGHLFGDDVLINLAGIMTDAIGESGFVCRFGGEEFLLCINSVDPDLIREKVAQIHSTFAAWYAQRMGGTATFSAGLALCRQGETLIALFNRADACLYEAKHSGKNRLVFNP